MSARRYSLRVFAAALAAAVALTTGEAAHAASAAAAAAAATRANAPSAARPLSQPAASAKARATGKPVLVDSATTRDSTLTANPDGSYTLAETPLPVRKKADGVWKSLDATLVRNADGTVSPAVSSSPLVLSGGGRGPLAIMKQGIDSLALTLPAALPAPVLSGASATYPSVLPGVDLVVTATAQGGFSDVFVVGNAAAARNPALTSLLTASVAAGELTVAADAQGDLTAADRHGHPVFTAPAPTLWDSSTSNSPTVAPPGARPAASSAQRPGRAAHIGRLKPTVTSGAITLNPDPAILTGAATTYPVYLDPAWTPGQSGWASVSEYFPSQKYWDSTPDPQGYAQVGNSGSMWSHTLFNFRLDDVDMAGAKIKSATLYLTEEGAYSCTPSTMDVYAPGTVLTSSNAYWDFWNGTSTGSVVGANSFAHGYSGCPAAGDSVPFNQTGLTALANDVAANKATQTLLLTGVNESTDYNSWKEFLVNSTTSPQLSITYNHPPNTPTSLTMSPGGSCTGVTAGLGDVVLYAGVSDLDGGTLGVAFNAYKTSSPSTVIKSTSYTAGAAGYLAATSGTTASLLIPKATLTAAAGGSPLSISWTVQLSDGSDQSGLSKTCSFTFDPTVPGAPTVTDAGQSTCGGGTYTVGTSVSFSATSTNSVTHYLFQLGSSAPISAQVNDPNDTNHTATASITPTRHTNILSVSAVTAGGNIGDSAVCVINATVPAFNAITATPTSISPTDASAPGDVTGDAVPDMLVVGGQYGAPPGLWLAPGQTNGAVLPNALNIGINGDGLNADGTAADWTGTDVLTGQFTGTGFQDVLALYTSGRTTSGSSTNGFVLASNGNDGSPLANIGDDSTTFAVTSLTGCVTDGLCTGLADKNGNIPVGEAQVANAGDLSANQNTPDLLTLTSGVLWLDPAATTVGAWQGGGSETALATVNPYCSITADNCTTGWSTWSITTAMVGTGNGALPALFARDNSTTAPSAGQLWYYSPAVLQDIANAAMTGGKSSDVPVEVDTSNTDVHSVPLIAAANINGALALRTLDRAWASNTPVAETYFLDTSNPAAPKLSYGPAGQALNMSSHSWALNDNTTTTVSAVTYPTASDTSAGLTATASGSQSASGVSTDATWHTGDLYDPDIRLNTTGTGARLTAGTGSLATTASAIVTNATFTAAAWVKPADEYTTESVLSQDGSDGSGFDLYGDANGTWDFALKNSDTAGGTFTTITGGAVQPGQWTLLTATYDATNAIMKLYQNGIEIASTTHTKVATGTSSSPWRIGADRTNASSPVTAHYFAGQIADVQTWNSVQPPAQAPTAGSYAAPVSPKRILDTRNKIGVSTTTPLAAGATLTLKITGQTVTNPVTGSSYTIPSTGVSAVGLTLAVTQPTAVSGFVTAYPDLTARPVTSNVNFTTGQTVSAYALVPVGTDGSIDLYNGSSGTVHLLADITGYYTTDSSAPAASTYNPIQPARILDTRSAYHIGGSTVAGSGTLTLTVAGADAKVLPTSGITAVAMNITVVNAVSSGNLTAYPGGAVPLASSVNFTAGTTTATTDIVPVGTGGTVSFYNNSAGTIDLIGDVSGYFTQSAAGQKYHPLAATRIVDTRQTTSPAGYSTTTVTAPSTIPDPGATMVLNVTATNEQTGGNLTIYSGANQPTTSNVNWPPSTSIANVALATTSSSQSKMYNNSSGTIDLIADTNGYFSYTGTPAAVSYPPSQSWNTGASWSAGANTVRFQTSDGNLAVYNDSGTLLWKSSATTQAATNTLQLTGAGLRILNAAGTVVWSSISSGTAATLAFQPDGNLALYDGSGNALWATGTTNS